MLKVANLVATTNTNRRYKAISLGKRFQRRMFPYITFY